MKTGTERHQQLELEVHEVKKIATVTAEDSWACRMEENLPWNQQKLSLLRF